MGHYWKSISYGQLRMEGEALDWMDLPKNWEDYCTVRAGIKIYDKQKLADEVSAS